MTRRGSLRRAVLLGAAFATTTGAFVVGGVVVGTPARALPVCTANAGGSGLSAAFVVSTAGQVVNSATFPPNGTLDATGCDVGIYVVPSATGASISGVTVTNANNHGIMAEGVSGVTIQNNTVQGNGIHANPNLSVDKAIQLVGVTNSVVIGNNVFNNIADGGISVTDEGSNFDPAAINGPAAPTPSTNDTISNNNIHDNFSGCAIVIESWVSGAGVDHVTASNNTITGHAGMFGPHGPVIGQIVVAGNAPGASVTNTTLTGNTIIQSFLSGITLHANAPGDVIRNTLIQSNLLDSNNWGHVNGAPQSDAIALEINNIPPPVTPVLDSTNISNNSLSNQYVGVWQDWHVTNTTLTANNFSGGSTQLYTQPVPGKGYWMVAGDGGAFTFGDAAFYGSEGATKLPAPVVGIAQTRDQGGYLTVGSDGSVYAHGDGISKGSLAGLVLNAPVAGIAMTPAPGAPPGTPGTNGLGYWLVAGDGGVFTYGDAGYHGSMGAVRLNAPVDGIAPSSDGLGYWLVAKDGGVFTFGDAGYHGSTGAIHLNAPIVGIVPTLSGKGYWLVGADGGVFTFGDAKYFGSMGATHLNAPVVGMASTADGNGYWLFARDGGVFTFGDATFAGSMGAVRLNSPMVGGTGTGSGGVEP